MPTEGSSLLPVTPPKPQATFGDFLRSFWPLCLISFGGPQAHIALFIDRYVSVPATAPPNVPRISETTFLELYALGQTLPGPGSTQVAASLGATFGGALGALVAFFMWQLPGFLAMTLVGIWFHGHLTQPDSVGFIQTVTDHALGLISAAFAFVLLAAFKIVSKVSAGSRFKMTIILISLFVAVTIPPQSSSWVFIVLLAGGGAIFYLHHAFIASRDPSMPVENLPQLDNWDSKVSPYTGIALLAFIALATVVIAFLPATDLAFRLLKIFWRIGLCVFGGGVVVVPMLLNEFIESGMLPSSVFLAGFGLFGCVPGPVFNIAVFLGAAILSWRGALCGTIGVFGPGVLLQIGLLPFWERVRKIKTTQIILQGTNSAAAGLILAGVWMLLRRALVGPTAFALVCTAAASATVFKLPPAANVLLHGVVGLALVSLGVGGPFHAMEALGVGDDG